MAAHFRPGRLRRQHGRPAGRTDESLLVKVLEAAYTEADPPRGRSVAVLAEMRP